MATTSSPGSRLEALPKVRLWKLPQQMLTTARSRTLSGVGGGGGAHCVGAAAWVSNGPGSRSLPLLEWRADVRVGVAVGMVYLWAGVVLALRWGGGLGGRDPCRYGGVDVGRWRWRRRGHGGLNGRLQVRGGDGYWGFGFSCAACQQECKSQHQCAKGAKNFHKPYLNVKGAGGGEGPLFCSRCALRSAHLIVAEAVGGVVVYEAGGLHQGVADGAAHELGAAAAQLFAEGVRLGRCGRDFVH